MKSIYAIPVDKNERWQYLLLIAAVLVNCSGLFITILGPDGALYASIAKTMVQQNNYVELFAEHKDWLDKPHFPFWITALSFKCFGFNTWAYKLPAILFLLIGAAYTYKLALLFYKKQVAFWAVIILLTAEHIIISNNDVRAEPYLVGLITGAIFHFYVAWKKSSWRHLFAGCLLSACAIMTKGTVAIIPIAGAIGGDLILKKNWKALFSIRWLLAVLLIFVFIMPELYCLWYQFDSHPEKIVFGQKAVSGIRFFFWDSQFGRFFNTGPIKGKGDPFFFMHTLLWAFLPWSILLIAAIISIIVKYRRRMMEKPEWLTVSGAVLTFIVFSLSRFQLPHYITIIFPLLAIITADYIDSAEGYNQRKFITVTQAVIIFILPLLAIVLFLLARPGHAVLSLVYLSVIIGIIAFVYRRNDYKWKQVSFVHTASVALIINLFFNTVFYPWLMRYQSGSEAAHYINNSYPGTPVIQLKKPYSYPMEFYLDDSLQTVDNVSDLNRMPTKSSLIYLPADSADNVKNYTIIRLFDNFPVSRLNGKFLNPQSRDKETETYALMINNSVVKN